ncbi:MAG: hypothetical protein EXS38_12095 [Opitutus sp.]|nr:hypothetical protein [Opitutus sp.]
MGFARADIGAGLRGFGLLALGCWLTGLEFRAAPAGRANETPPRLTPLEEAKTFALAPGWQITLVADGTSIHEPIAAQWAADGRLWVLELGTPPADGAADHERGPGGVAVLEDTDGDGRMDRRTTFASGLHAPVGLALVGGGVMVFDPPHYWFLRDANADSVADERIWMASESGEVLPRRYGSNSLTLAMDNWLYSPLGATRLRYAGSGGFVRDTTARRARRSVTQDEAGRLYHGGDAHTLCVDRLPSPYVRRNLGYPITGTPEAIAMGWPAGWTPVEIGRPAAEKESDGPSWSVGDAMIYRGKGVDGDGEVFVTEPASGKIWRSPLGASATRKASAVLSSSDANFRPVSLAQGPDAAIYVVDRYGAGAAQPAAGRDDAHDIDASRGGRIWRIAPAASEKSGPKLADVPLAKWVEALGDGSGWRRDTAQRLLVEKAEPAATPLVREFVTNAATPLGRLHALWTLDGLDAVDPPTILRALSDLDSRVRVAAIRLAERFFFDEEDAKIFRRLEELVTDPDQHVLLQLALSFGEVGTPKADAILRGILVHAGGQPHFTGAILSGIGGRESDFILEWAGVYTPPSFVLANAAAAATEAALVTYDMRWMLWRAQDHARIDKIFEIAAESTTPPWLRAAVLEGVGRRIKGNAAGRAGAVNLGFEPGPLLRLSADRDPAMAARAQQLLHFINWPGKSRSMEPAPLAPAHQALYEKGRVGFAVMCAGCHQPQGQGFANFAPPLAGSRWVQGDECILARIVLCGKVQGQYSMPAFRAPFDDEALAAVLTFIRNTWGNAAGAVTPAVMAAVRAETAARQPMAHTDGELVELTQELSHR